MEVNLEGLFDESHNHVIHQMNHTSIFFQYDECNVKFCVEVSLGVQVTSTNVIVTFHKSLSGSAVAHNSVP